MDEYNKQLQIESEIKNTFNLDALGLEFWPMANHVRVLPDESPLRLVYENEKGRFESDKKIHEDLSSLVGFEITYRKDGCDREITAIILFSAINKKDLSSMGKHKTVTLGKVRKFAESIHPYAKIVNETVASAMWQNASDFYTMKFMLGKKNFEFPGIMCMSSCEESYNNKENMMDFDLSMGIWDYTPDKNAKVFIEMCDQIWCYIEKG